MAIATGFGLGILALIVGADWLVKGAVSLAQRLQISTVVIGLTVVAFGTSAPELAVSMQAAANGSSDIAIGNVVGSNIQNLMLVLGLSAMFVSLRVSRRILLVDMPLLLVLSAALAVMAADGRISQSDGLLLVMTLLAYTCLTIRHGREKPDMLPLDSSTVVEPSASLLTKKDNHETPSNGTGATATSIVLVLVGLCLLSAGGDMFVEAARTLAIRMGMSELTIGVTVVAFGTSLPEIVTCVLATIRGHRELAVGNVVGSNIFNILCVLGVASLTTQGGFTLSATAVGFDIPLMLAVTVLSFAVCLTGNRIVRGEGLFMLLIFGSYVGWLVTKEIGTPALTTPFAMGGIGLTIVLIGFQIHGLFSQRWLPVPNA
ncbi:MAG: calcium/sodium antiporter [Rhodopirellula sp.]|nr:calcium/sodium antiporter [Rhodopirellula sp.]